MNAADVTPLVLTFNESPNIQRTLERLSWARETVVVDCYSNDDTLELVRANPRVRVLQRRFDTFAAQCNFGLENIESPWVLSLDADYVLSHELIDEILTLSPAAHVAGFSVRFRYCVAGRPLRASLYPPRVALYRRDKARYRNDGHGHRVQIEGHVGTLRGVIFHDDRKPLDRWLGDQDRYARLEVTKLDAAERSISWPDYVRQQVVLAPILVPVYLLLWKGLILDGWPGWIYVCQRTIAELILSLRLAEAGLIRSAPSSEQR